MKEIMKIKRITKVSYDKPVAVYDVVNSLPNHNLVVKTNTSEIISHNCGFV